MSTENKFIRGRPHGGISIKWRKTLSRGVKIIQYDDERILGIELKTSDFIILILCMPYECNEFYDDFCFYLDKVKCIIESANTPYVFVMGDFNADIKSSSIFGSELIEFCNRNDLCFIDKSMLLFDRLSAWPEVRGTADTDGGAYSPFRSILLVLTHDFIITQLYGPACGDG